VLRIKVKEACDFISFTDTCCVSGSSTRTEGQFPLGHEMDAMGINRDVPQRGVSTIWVDNGTLHMDRWLVPSVAVEVLDFVGNPSERL